MEKYKPKTTPKTDTGSEGIRKRMEKITLQSAGKLVDIKTCHKENVIKANNEDKMLTTRANYNILETSKLNAMAPAFVPRNYNYTASKRLDNPHQPFQPLEREFIVFNNKRIKNELVNIKHIYDTNKIDMEKAVGKYVTELFEEVQNVLDRERNKIRRQLEKQLYMQRMANESLYIKRLYQSNELETQKAMVEHVADLFGKVKKMLDDEKNETRRKLDQQRYTQRMANESLYIKRFHQSNELETQKAVCEHVTDLFGDVQKMLEYEKNETRRKIDQQRYTQRMTNESLYIKRFHQSSKLETQKAVDEHVNDLLGDVQKMLDADKYETRRKLDQQRYTQRMTNKSLYIKRFHQSNELETQKAVGEHVTDLFGEVKQMLDAEKYETRRKLDQQRYMQRMANESLYIKRFRQSNELETHKALGEHVTNLFGEVKKKLEDEKNETRRKLDQQRYVQRMANESLHIKRFHQSYKLEKQKAVGHHVTELIENVQTLLDDERHEIRRKIYQETYIQRMTIESLNIKSFHDHNKLEIQKAVGEHVTELFEKVKHIFDAESSSRNTNIATLKIEPVDGNDKSMEESFKVTSQHAEKMACKSEVQHSNANVDKLLDEVNSHKINDEFLTMNGNDDHLVAKVFDEIIEYDENPYIRMMCFD